MARSRHQTGTIAETGKTVKKWTGFFYVYDENGVRHRKSVDLGPRKDQKKWEAQQKLQKIIDQESKIIRKVGNGDTFGWYWEEKFIYSRAWSKTTNKWIAGVFKLHVLPTLGPMKVTAIHRDHIVNLMNAMSVYSRSMVRAVRVYIRLVFDSLIEDGLIVSDPTRKVKLTGIQPPRRQRYLEPDEIARLMAELNTRDRLICRIAIVLGLRPAELVALKWDDFHPEKQQLFIDESFRRGEWKKPKTDTSFGWVTMPPSIIKDLLEWKKQSCSHLIFPSRSNTPISADDFIHRKLMPAAVRAGIMEARPKNLPKGKVWTNKRTAVNFQAFRRTCATWCMQHGSLKDVQAHMRHANPATTLNHYAQDIPASVRTAVEGLDGFLCPGSLPQAPQQLSVQ